MGSRIQWSREELKGRSKVVLRAHYWRIVLVTVLLSFLIEPDSMVFGTVRPFLNEISTSEDFFSKVNPSNGFDFLDRKTGLFESGNWTINERSYGGMAFFGTVIVAVVGLVLVGLAGGILVEIFVVNPIYVGAMRFYVRSFNTKPQFKDFFYAFENKYKNVVSVMFLRDLYTVLWCMLFIVPGIVKSYEYMMIPYLLAENPEMDANQAFAVSRQMMEGQKWRAFVLDLSFLGWRILSALTLGILGLFYVDAYSSLTGAALYRRLRGLDSIPQNVYYDGMEYDTEQGWYERPEE